MLLASHQGSFDAVCHACNVGSQDVPLSRLVVVDLRALETKTDRYHLQWECPYCTATESWPDSHSPAIQDLGKQLGLI